MGNKEEKNNTVPNGSMEITGRRHKSARPGRISYVPISDEDLAPYEPPVRKKYKGLKITGIAVAMVIVSAGAAYAGMSYYYSDKFFEGTSIQGMGYGLLPMLAGVAELAGRGITAMVAAAHKSYFGACMASPMAWVLAGGLLIVMYFYVMKDMKRRLGL